MRFIELPWSITSNSEIFLESLRTCKLKIGKICVILCVSMIIFVLQKWWKQNFKENFTTKIILGAFYNSRKWVLFSEFYKIFRLEAFSKKFVLPKFFVLPILQMNRHLATPSIPPLLPFRVIISVISNQKFVVLELFQNWNILTRNICVNKTVTIVNDWNVFW